MPVGLPYVLTGSRPAKNGQPSICLSQCAPNVGIRKVGGGAHKIPLIWAGHKTKEQTLEKWDPTTRTILRINPNRIRLTVKYDSGGPDNAPCPVLDGGFINDDGEMYDGGGVDTNICY
jgi:hypothetical protein